MVPVLQPLEVALRSPVGSGSRAQDELVDQVEHVVRADCPESPRQRAAPGTGGGAPRRRRRAPLQVGIGPQALNGSPSATEPPVR